MAAGTGDQGQGAQGGTEGGKPDEGEQQQGSETEGAAGGADEEFDKDRALATIRTQREAEKTLRSQLKAAEDKATKLEREKLSESERVAAERDEAKARVVELETAVEGAVKRTAVTAEATRMQFRNPAIAHRLLDLSDIRVEDGEAVGVARALEKLLKDDPYLANGTAGGSDGGQRGGSTSDTDITAGMRAQLGR